MKISVVIPLYNKKDSVIKTLESVFKQTFQPEEIIVVNDGSTDGSENLVKSLNNPLLRIVNHPNTGVSFARNRGVDEATGDWIAFLDADDIWMPEFLEKMNMLSDTFPETNILASAYMIQNQKGVRKNILINRMPFEGEHGILENYFEVSSVSHPPICSSAVVIKRDSLKIIGGFPPGVKSGEDLITWAKLAAKFEIAYTKKPLSVFVQNEVYSYNGLPTRIPQEPDIVGDELAALAKKHSAIPGIRKYVSHWFKMRSSIYLRLGEKRKAYSEALKSLSYNPFNFKILIYLVILPLPVSIINKVFVKLGKS
jgi:glycosyltransferase involved in cell wall biosynthesis